MHTDVQKYIFARFDQYNDKLLPQTVRDHLGYWIYPGFYREENLHECGLNWHDGAYMLGIGRDSDDQERFLQIAEFLYSDPAV